MVSEHAASCSQLSLGRKQRHTITSTALTSSATMHPILAVSRPCVNAGLTSNKRDVSACSARPVQPIGAVASAPAAVTVSRPQRLQSVSWKQTRSAQVPSLQRAPRQQHVVQQQPCQRAGALPAWAEHYRRQVRSLPQGQAALYNLLHAVERLLQKAQHCGEHSGVMKAYLALGLIDVTSQAWQQRSAQLADMKNKMPIEQYKQQELEAELALSGCRFMRIEASQQLAKQLHALLDDEGYCPSLNLGTLPAPHALGLRVPQLLREGLGLDLQNPTIRPPASADELCNLPWEQYNLLSADQSMCGDWQFCYWVGDATWVPAPFGKFSTHELAALLTQDTMLASLFNGIWGRALVSAAQEQGLPVAATQPLLQQQQQQQPVQQQLGAAAGAAAGMPEAVKQLLEESMGLQAGTTFRARVHQFSAAVAAVRSAMLGGAMPAPNAGVQGN